jgi:hypothetical protein
MSETHRVLSKKHAFQIGLPISIEIYLDIEFVHVRYDIMSTIEQLPVRDSKGRFTQRCTSSQKAEYTREVAADVAMHVLGIHIDIYGCLKHMTKRRSATEHHKAVAMLDLYEQALNAIMRDLRYNLARRYGRLRQLNR